jgi:predicted amidohydrolase
MEIIFKMKSEEMKNVYADTFRRLSTFYKVTIIAGSIILPQAEINPTSNEIQLKGGTVYNSSLIFLPDGKIHPRIGIKYNLSMAEQPNRCIPGNREKKIRFYSLKISELYCQMIPFTIQSMLKMERTKK